MPSGACRARGGWWSEDPEALLRNLEPLLTRRQRACPIRAQPQVALVEQVLPAVAEEHRGDERQPDRVVAGAFGEPDALEADHSGRVGARRRAAARLAPDPPAVAGEQGGVAAPLGDLAGHPVVAAHEVGDEERARLAVELLRRPLLLDDAV